MACALGAHAGEDDGSLLQCGVRLGGSELAYRPASVASRGRAVNFKRQSANAEGLRPAAFAEAPPTSFEFRNAHANRRLPAVLAIARVGCTWR